MQIFVSKTAVTVKQGSDDRQSWPTFVGVV